VLLALGEHRKSGNQPTPQEGNRRLSLLTMGGLEKVRIGYGSSRETGVHCFCTWADKLSPICDPLAELKQGSLFFHKLDSTPRRGELSREDQT
jgi:hypothetical protein